MRDLKEHQVTRHNRERVRVAALDRAGALYGVTVTGAPVEANLYVRFQQGDPELTGPNGVTEEALLAMLLDRLRQQDQSRNVALAVEHLEKALARLGKRAKALGED